MGYVCSWYEKRVVEKTVFFSPFFFLFIYLVFHFYIYFYFFDFFFLLIYFTAGSSLSFLYSRAHERGCFLPFFILFFFTDYMHMEYGRSRACIRRPFLFAAKIYPFFFFFPSSFSSTCMYMSCFPHSCLQSTNLITFG